MAPKSTIMILCRFEQPIFFLLGLSWIVSAGSTNVEAALDVQRPDRLETSAYYKWSTSTSYLFSYTHVDLQPTLESLKQVAHGLINFKLKTSLTGCKTTSHLWLYFYGTCPSIICTQSTPDVTHTLGQLWAKMLCSNPKVEPINCTSFISLYTLLPWQLGSSWSYFQNVETF